MISDFLIGCLYAPIGISIAAVGCYFFIYKKDKYINNITLVIITISIGITGTILMVLNNWINGYYGINTSFSSILGFITGCAICPYIGLSNKNLRKLTKADEAI